MTVLPKISVVLPSYNGERFLALSVESVIAQTEKDWELIIVDDCSTDGTLKIAENYAAMDKRVRVISNGKNMKLPASLNIGFTQAKGEYFTWTSDDNLYRPNALEILSKYLDENPGTDFVTANMDLIAEDGAFLGIYYDSTDTLSQTDLILACNISGAFMYRRTAADKAGGYDETLFCAEDYDYWCRVALIGKISYINENIYQYRKHPNSLSNTKKKEAIDKKIYVQGKYLDAFCERFSLSAVERLKIAVINKSRIDKSALSLGLRATFQLLKLRKSAAKIASGLIFWDRALRRKIRRQLGFSINGRKR
jgi:glycosyltransferase involved in cell wall biosynthesis